MRLDAVGIPVQMRAELWSGPFPPGWVQVAARTSTAAGRALPALNGEPTATAGARRNKRRGGEVT